MVTVLKASLRSRTVGSPESGSGLGSARIYRSAGLPTGAEAQALARIRPSRLWFARLLAAGSRDRPERTRSRGSWTGSCPAMSSRDPLPWPPSAQGSFARAGDDPTSGRPHGSPRRALPLLHRSYEPMRKTESLLAARVVPRARGLCRLPPAPAGRWSLPRLSLRPVRRRSDPYPAALLGRTCPFLRRGHRSQPTRNGLDARIYPHVAASAGSRMSRLQSFVHLRAPTLARPPNCSDRGVRMTPGRQAFHTTHRPDGYPLRMWRCFVSDTDN